MKVLYDDFLDFAIAHKEMMIRLKLEEKNKMKHIEITDEEYEKLVTLGFLKEETLFNEAWSPKEDGDYRYQLIIKSYEDKDIAYKDDCLSISCFKTQEELIQRAKEIKVYNLLKNFSLANGGDKINWEGRESIYAPTQWKYFIEREDQKWTINSTLSQTPSEVYFISREVAEEALRKYKTELEEVIGKCQA